MNLGFHNIIQLLKYPVLIAMVYTMVVQPFAMTFVLMSQADYEWVSLDTIEDSNEEEKEDTRFEKKDEKKLSVFEYQLANFERFSSRDKQIIIHGFCLEIPIPPPERA